MSRYSDCTELYIAPDGTGNGLSIDKPLSSLADALKIIEQMRGGGLFQPITIRMSAGTYLLKDTLRIVPAMSGITVVPYGNGPVTIAGGRQIKGFKKDIFQGKDCFSAYLPEVESGAWRFTDLYVDGLRADRPHLPENGYFLMEDTEQQGPNQCYPSGKFRAAAEDIALFGKLHAFGDCFVSFNHYWVDEHTPIGSFDSESGWITMAYRSRYTIKPGQEYLLENSAEAFGKPNEWYLDRETGMLYYMPRNAEQTPDTIEVWAPVLSQLVTIAGTPEDPATGIRFRNCIFACTRGDYAYRNADGTACASDSQGVSSAHGSITVSYAHNIRFEGCTLRNFGVHGFDIQKGCRSVAIDGCRIYDGGAGGVRICGGAYGCADADKTYACSITNSTIRHVGQRYYSACGVLIMHAFEIEVSHNEIADLYYTGISCGWVWGYAKSICRDNRICKNHIHHLGQGRLSDMGGVYLLGAQSGTVVSGNVIHDIQCRDYGGWALYTDEGSAGILLEDNICYNTSSNSYHQHYGTQNVVRNNIFANAGEPLLCVSRPEAHRSILFTGNILCSSGSAFLSKYRQKAPGEYSVADGAIVSRGNILWGNCAYSDEEGLETLDAAQAKGLEEGSIITDPMLDDRWQPAEDSPALRMGFRAIDMSDAGPAGGTKWTND